MKTNYQNVRLKKGFMREKEDLNRNVTIKAVYDRFKESGRIDAFKFDWKEGMPNQPHIFWDSDVAKWMEGAAYIISREDDGELKNELYEKTEWLIDQIEKNQCEDGYFNLYFTIVAPDKRYTNIDLHELYCAGHLMEAACAYYEATGRDRFLRLMEKYADYISLRFIEKQDTAFSVPGHEEIELALCKMYRVTENKKYLEMAKFFIDRRGDGDAKNGEPWKQIQTHLPCREQREAVGHAVRATYLYSGMADIAREYDDMELSEACHALWNDILSKKMYITGGIGSTCHGEAFSYPYDLPNESAYTETCASIGMMFFAHRMFLLDSKNGVPSSSYADIIETEMYNGVLSGLSLDGEKFFYENPLEVYLPNHKKEGLRLPINQRVKIFWCSCCPPNLNRVLSSLGQYFYAYDEKSGAVYVNQFGESEFDNGIARVRQTTDYPRCGEVTIESNVPVYVRRPAWAREVYITEMPKKDGQTQQLQLENGYYYFEAGKTVIKFNMQPTLVTSSPRVVENIGKAALRRGPVIYCAEGVDNDGDVHSLVFDKFKIKDAEVIPNSEIGLPEIVADGYRISENPCRDISELYSVVSYFYEEGDPACEKTEDYEGKSYLPVKIKLIPYNSFANRGETNMLVYLGYR